MARILVIEDELQVRRLLRGYLSRRGFRVYESATAEEGIEKVRTLRPYLILLDLSLPDRDGVDMVRTIRSGTSAPIIAMAGSGNAASIASVLDSGADDCVIKPFSILELVTRIQVALRQAMRLFPATAFRDGEITVDPITGMVTVGEETVRLTPTEYAVLRVLIRHAGEVVPYRRLLSELGSPGVHDGRNHLRVYVNKLRNIFEKQPGEDGILATVPGVGYRLRRRE